jgi:ligand-binding SRPBCC domain-containing protein
VDGGADRKEWFDKRAMKIFRFEASLWLPRPIEEVFEFFSDALNLEKITPPWLQFQVITPKPIQIHRGAEIDYRLRIHGFPVRWRSRITEWDPPHRFVDEQVRGPYRAWTHDHRFSEDAGGTLCQDAVQYAPLGGSPMNKLFVERDVAEIFAYRADRLKEFFLEC